MPTTDPGPSRHVQTVLRMLSSQRHAGKIQGTPPFGVALTPAWGRFLIGQLVLTPGIDECSPKVVAEVLRTGTRADRPGIWCLLRCQGQVLPSALIHEDALGAVVEEEASDMEYGGLMAGTAVSRQASGPFARRSGALAAR